MPDLFFHAHIKVMEYKNLTKAIAKADTFSNDPIKEQLTEILSRVFVHDGCQISVRYSNGRFSTCRSFSQCKIIPKKEKTPSLADNLLNAREFDPKIALLPHYFRSNTPMSRDCFAIEFFSMKGKLLDISCLTPPTFLLKNKAGVFQALWVFDSDFVEEAREDVCDLPDIPFNISDDAEERAYAEHLYIPYYEEEALTEYENSVVFFIDHIDVPLEVIYAKDEIYDVTDFRRTILNALGKDLDDDEEEDKREYEEEEEECDEEDEEEVEDIAHEHPKDTHTVDRTSYEPKGPFVEDLSFFAKRKFDLLRLLHQFPAAIAPVANDFLYIAGCNECYMVPHKDTKKPFELMDEWNDYLNKYMPWGVSEEELKKIKFSIATRGPRNYSNIRLGKILPMHLLKYPYADSYTPAQLAKVKKAEAFARAHKKTRKIKTTMKLVNAIAAYNAEGMSVTEIAKKADCSRQTVYNYMKKYKRSMTAKKCDVERKKLKENFEERAAEIVAPVKEAAGIFSGSLSNAPPGIRPAFM